VEIITHSRGRVHVLMASGEEVPMNQELVGQAVEFMTKAHSFAVLTGAGVSKESGIPTFRDAQTGLWAKYDPEQLASPSGFRKDPALVWQWYDMRRQKLAEVKPNPGHYAIAALDEIVRDLVVLTQNVDGLHRAAGSRNVVELHGNISTFHCFERNHVADDVPVGLSDPPVCHCGSLIRPSVVWFGEALSEDALRKAFDAAQHCDLMFVIGTSGLVHPAASLPFITRRKGGVVIEVNPDQTPITEVANVFIKQASGTAMPALLEGYKRAVMG
jgi:NAD-dependent deacetylase